MLISRRQIQRSWQDSRVEQYESRGNLAAGKRTADQIILLKDYDPEIIRNFVERVRVYPSGEIEIDMRTSSGFAYSALLKSIKVSSRSVGQ